MRKLVLVCLVGALGCAETRYYHQPNEQVTATLSGFPAARYGVPPSVPRGEVTAATFGVATVEVRGRSSIEALHVRVQVSNDDDDGPWALDTRSVRAELAGAAPYRPAFVNGTATDLPIVSIPRGSRRTIDFYFTLPPDLAGASDLPAFEVIWEVQTPRRAVARRTPFERMRLDPVVTTFDYARGLGRGPYWWYDPFFYPGPMIATPILVNRLRPRTYVGAPPH